MLIYRLVHFHDQVPDIDTGLKRRNRELCKPIMQLFYDSSMETQAEIKSMLEHFLAIKKHRKENTIEVVLFPLIINLISEYGIELPASSIWHRIIAGGADGYYDERRPNEYQTADFGTIYRNSITNIICDKFGAQRRHKERGNILIFDQEKLVKIGKFYDIETSIQLKLPAAEDKAEGSEGSEGFRTVQDSSEQNLSIEHTNNQNNIPEIFEQISDNNSNNITTRDERLLNTATKSSEPSDPSASSPTANSEDPITSNSIYRIGRSDNWVAKTAD